jgi:hypothetical protein
MVRLRLRGGSRDAAPVCLLGGFSGLRATRDDGSGTGEVALATPAANHRSGIQALVMLPLGWFGSFFAPAAPPGRASLVFLGSCFKARSVCASLTVVRRSLRMRATCALKNLASSAIADRQRHRAEWGSSEAADLVTGAVGKVWRHFSRRALGVARVTRRPTAPHLPEADAAGEQLALPLSDFRTILGAGLSACAASRGRSQPATGRPPGSPATVADKPIYRADAVQHWRGSQSQPVKRRSWQL